MSQKGTQATADAYEGRTGSTGGEMRLYKRDKYHFKMPIPQLRNELL
jgi:hypothetical protein